MRAWSSSGTRVVLAVVFLAALAASCKQEAPPPPPDVQPDVAKVKTVDLTPLEAALNAPADAAGALAALRSLDEALKTPGALPADQVERAQSLRTNAGFALLTVSVLTGSDPAPVAAVLGLSDVKQPSEALLAFAKQGGAQSPLAKAAAVVAWLAAGPDAKSGTPAPAAAEVRTLAREDSLPGVAVRATALKLLTGVLGDATKAAEEPRPALLAGKLGALLCAKCADLPAAPPDQRASLLYAPDNAGYVCDAAQAALAGKAPYAYPQALAASCSPADYGLTDPVELSLLTAGNAILLKALAFAAEARRPLTDPKSPLAAQLGEEGKQMDAVAARLVVELGLPWLPVPPEARAGEAERLLPPLLGPPVAVRRTNPPLETLVVDEKGVSLALRPVAVLEAPGVTLAERKSGLAYPGPQVIAVDAIDDSDRKRDEAAKAAKTPVPDPDVITEVAEAAKAWATKADELSATVYAGLDPKLDNKQRPQDQRTAVLTIDAASPAWLLRRAMASIKSVGFARMMLQQPAPEDLAGESVLPVVFKTEQGLPDTVAQVKFKRPTLVWVRPNEVRLFPPDKRTAPKSPKPATPLPSLSWPEKTHTTLHPQTKELFSVTVPMPEDNLPVGPAVAQAVQKMEQDYDDGNVVYIVTDDQTALSGRVLEVAQAVSALPGTAVQPLDALDPGLVCDGPTCPTRVPVLFPDVRIPKLPGEAKPVEAPAKLGFCDQGNIKRVVSGREGSYRFCYEKELQLEPALTGRVTVRFVIGLDGRVTTASVGSSTLRNRNVEQCVLKVFQSLAFDKPQGAGVCIVNWPLQFTNN